MLLSTLCKLFQKAQLFLASNCRPISWNFVVYLFQLLPQFFVNNFIRNSNYCNNCGRNIFFFFSFETDIISSWTLPRAHICPQFSIPTNCQNPLFMVKCIIWIIPWDMVLYLCLCIEQIKRNGYWIEWDRERKQHETNLSIYINRTLFLMLLALVLLKA